MTTILDLPREIRDLIYTIVLDSKLSPPSSFVERRDDYVHMSSSYGSSEYFGEHCNQYPIQPVSISSSGLLLTSRQIRTEILDVIARRKVQKQLWYKIDCMIEDEKRIYPTWLSVPAVSFHIDTVEVNFRMREQRDDQYGFTPGDGGPSFMIWSLLALLNRFLERGPNFLSSYRTRQKIEVELITLNVVTALEPTEKSNSQDWKTNSSRGKHLAAPFHYIKNELDHLLSRTKYTTEHAETVYGGVHRMKLMLDGETKMEWDLVAMEVERQRALALST